MLIHSSIVGVLALLLPAIASAQTQPAPAATRPSPIVVGNRGGYSPHPEFDAPGTASLKTGWSLDGARVQVKQLGHYSCGTDAPLDDPTVSGSAPYLLGGAGAVGTGNADAPAFSKITKLAGKGGFGIEYVAPNNGLGLSGQGASYIYRLDRASFHRIQCDLPWTGAVRSRMKH
jgi:hypothetical protein